MYRGSLVLACMWVIPEDKLKELALHVAFELGNGYAIFNSPYLRQSEEVLAAKAEQAHYLLALLLDPDCVEVNGKLVTYEGVLE